MTLWVIGDSYATHKKQSKKYKHLEDTWVERTGRTLNLSIVSNSKISVTVEYIFHKFNNIAKQFQSQDIVIITIPYFERRWHFRSKPLKIFFPTDEEQDAINLYNLNLRHFTEIHETFLENFLYHVNYITKRLDLHTIMIPTFYDSEKLLTSLNYDFKNINFANKSLGELSFLELTENCRNDEAMEWLQTKDPRVNHLVRNNHLVLSDKIVNNIINKEKLDFTTGFQSNFFDIKLSNDQEFVSDQLFDNIMERTHRIKLSNLL